MQNRIRAAAFILLIAITMMSASLSDDQKLLQKSKSLIFDAKWKEAQTLIDEIIVKYPKSGSYPSALFYKAKCLESLGNPAEALEFYLKYLNDEKTPGFKEDAQIAVIDISYLLYSSGKNEYLKNIMNFLNSGADTVPRYYAAFKLSYIKNRDIAKRGIPILKEIILNESDSDLRDRAKIAILRIDPSILKKIEDESRSGQKMIRFTIFSKEEKKIQFNVEIPLSLADLLFESLDESGWNLEDIKMNKAELKKEIMEKIEKAKTGVVTVELEDVIIKIDIH